MDPITWLTGKLVAVVMAIALLIAVPTAIVMTVKYEGISFLGWSIVDGAKNYKPARDQAIANLKVCQANEALDKKSIDAQNTAIKGLGKAGQQSTDAANAALAQVKANAANLKARLAQIQAESLNRKSPADAVISMSKIARDGLK